MIQATLTIPYRLEAIEPLQLLLLEQEPWSVYTGRVTKQELVRWLAAVLSGEEYQARIDCGMAGDALVCLIYAYPLVQDLNYRLMTSWGTLSDRSVELIEATESISFRLSTHERTKYPIRELRSVAWKDQCYGPSGEIVHPPELTSDGEGVVCAAPVYGTATVRYIYERHAYILNAPRREGALGNHYTAVITGIYDGGLEVLVVEMPPGVEAFEADPNAICGLGGGGTYGGTAEWPEEDDVIQPQTASRETVIDYCTQKIHSDTFI